MVKNPPANTGDIRDVGLIPGSGRLLEKEMAIYSSGPPEDLPDPGNEPKSAVSPALQAAFLPPEPSGKS